MSSNRKKRLSGLGFPVLLCLKTSVIPAQPVSPAKVEISSTHRFTPRDFRLRGNDGVNEDENKRHVLKKQEFSNQISIKESSVHFGHSHETRHSHIARHPRESGNPADPTPEFSHKPCVSFRKTGQVVVEYILLLVVSVLIATILINFVNVKNEGILFQKWRNILTVIGEDISS